MPVLLSPDHRDPAYIKIVDTAAAAIAAQPNLGHICAPHMRTVHSSSTKRCSWH